MKDLLAVEEKEEDYELLECTLDTGAAINVAPRKMIEDPETLMPATDTCKYISATGTETKEKAKMKVDGLNEYWEKINGMFSVMEPDAVKMLASAVRTCRAGNRVVLDLESGSYIQNKSNGRRTPLFVKGDTFKFNIWRRKKQVSLMQQQKIEELFNRGDELQRDFHRQVRVRQP